MKPNPLNHNNYRPISNLSIFTKTLERILAKQLIYYLISHKIHHIFQSAYLPSKSTETAPSKILSDIPTNLDNKNGTIFVLLNLSSAFDTIDHYLYSSTAMLSFTIPHHRILLNTEFFKILYLCVYSTYQNTSILIYIYIYIYIYISIPRKLHWHVPIYLYAIESSIQFYYWLIKQYTMTLLTT